MSELRKIFEILCSYLPVYLKISYPRQGVNKCELCKKFSKILCPYSPRLGNFLSRIRGKNKSGQGEKNERVAWTISKNPMFLSLSTWKFRIQDTGLTNEQERVKKWVLRNQNSKILCSSLSLSPILPVDLKISCSGQKVKKWVSYVNKFRNSSVPIPHRLKKCRVQDQDDGVNNE